MKTVCAFKSAACNRPESRNKHQRKSKTLAKIDQNLKKREASAESICSIHEELPAANFEFQPRLKRISKINPSLKTIHIIGKIKTLPNLNMNTNSIFIKSRGRRQKSRQFELEKTKNRPFSKIDAEAENGETKSKREEQEKTKLSANRKCVRSMGKLGFRSGRLRKKGFWGRKIDELCRASFNKISYSRAIKKMSKVRKTLRKLFLKNNCKEVFRKKFELSFTFEANEAPLQNENSPLIFPINPKIPNQKLGPSKSGPTHSAEINKTDFGEKPIRPATAILNDPRQIRGKVHLLDFQIQSASFNWQKSKRFGKSARQSNHLLNANLHLFNSSC